MWQDPIVEQIHKIREEHARKFKFDLQEIYRDLKEQELKSEHKVVSLPLQKSSLEVVRS